jgi:RNA polymerase sigma factor for flagellar operon FliA
MFEATENLDASQSVFGEEQGQRMISEHIPLIKFHASRFAAQLPSANDVDQIINAGVIGLIRAGESYQSGCGLEFKTHAHKCIQAAMADRLLELYSKPRWISPKAKKLTTTSQKLRPRLQREASDLELCLALGIDAEELALYLLTAQLSGLSIGSFSEVSRASDHDEAGEMHLGYHPEGLANKPRVVLKRKEFLKMLTEEVNHLPRTERLVLSLHYFEELTMKEISAVLRIGERRVLQLHTKAILRLRTRLRRLQHWPA